MIEILALSAGAALITIISDTFFDETPRPVALLDALMTRLELRFQRVQLLAGGGNEQLRAIALDDWLRSNAGTTDIHPLDRDYFEQQLKFAYEEATD
jgi:hypothetical protein